MKRQVIRIVSLFLCLRMAVSCGSIINGTTQDIDVRSNPDNAEVWINGARIGVTPTRLTLKRKTSHNIKIVLPGHKDAEIKIDNTVSAWIIGNIIFGGIIGCAVDLISGGAYDLKPDRLDINLVKAVAYDGKKIVIPQSEMDNVREIRFLDEFGVQVASVSLVWVN